MRVEFWGLGPLVTFGEGIHTDWAAAGLTSNEGAGLEEGKGGGTDTGFCSGDGESEGKD